MVDLADPKMQRLTQDIVAMAEMVELNLDTAVMALVDRNTRFAYQVIALDTDIDEMEIFIDRECLELLTDKSKDGGTFRFLTAAMKINNDLERISNQAVIIAEHVLEMLRMHPPEKGLPEMSPILERVEVMVRQSVDALIRRDVELAWQIWEEHAAGIDEFRRLIDGLAVSITKKPKEAVRTVHLIQATMALALVGEYTKDIAEEVIYMREGIIVKHHEREFRAKKRVEAGAAGRN